MRLCVFSKFIHAWHVYVPCCARLQSTQFATHQSSYLYKSRIETKFVVQSPPKNCPRLFPKWQCFPGLISRSPYPVDFPNSKNGGKWGKFSARLYPDFSSTSPTQKGKVKKFPLLSPGREGFPRPNTTIPYTPPTFSTQKNGEKKKKSPLAFF